MPFKIAVIGCGWVANFGHGPASRRYASENPDSELIACCDIKQETAESFRSKFGFSKAFTDYRRMLELTGPDAVCLCVPEKETAGIAMDLLERKIPVLIEKPPGINAAQCSRLLDASERRGVPHAVAWNRRSMPLVVKFREILGSLENGYPLQSLSYRMERVDRAENNFEDTAVHGIDLAAYLGKGDYRELFLDYQAHLSGADNIESGDTESGDTGSGNNKRRNTEPGDKETGDTKPGKKESGDKVTGNWKSGRKNPRNIYIRGTLETGCRVSMDFHPLSGIVREGITARFRDYLVRMEMPVWDRKETEGKIELFQKNRCLEEHHSRKLSKDETDEFGFFLENRLFFDALRRGERPEHGLNTSMQVMQILDCLKNNLPRYINK